MVSRQITIVNRDGFHMRAAGDFAKAMAAFQSEVTVSSANKSVNGKSIMHLIASGFQKGTVKAQMRKPSWTAPAQ